MKKVFLAVAVLMLAASAAYPAAGNLGVEVNNLVGPVSPYGYLISLFEMVEGAPLPPIQSGQRITLAYDITDQFLVSGGVSLLSIAGKDLLGGELGYKGETLTSTGICLGLKYRITTGALAPVIGLNAEMASVTAPKDYLGGDLESLSGLVVQATAGVEWTLTPGFSMLLDVIVAEVGSGSIKVSGDTYDLDGQFQMLPGGSIGFRWYFI